MSSSRAKLIVAALTTLVFSSILFCWRKSGEPNIHGVQQRQLLRERSANITYFKRSRAELLNDEKVQAFRFPSDEEAITLAELSQPPIPSSNENDEKRLFICGRATNVDPLEHLSLSEQYYGKCKSLKTRVRDSRPTPILLLEGNQAFGRTGNHIVVLLHAIQYTRDHKIALGMMADSWASKLLHNSLGSYQGHDGFAKLEQELCIKDMIGWFPIHSNLVMTRKLFYYSSSSSFQEYIDTSKFVLQRIYSNTIQAYMDTGKFVLKRIYSNTNTPQCQGINAAFGSSNVIEKDVIYTAIHMRQLEDQGYKMLKHIGEHSGCDGHGALDMLPDYVTSILEPLDMLAHPIVVITDGESQEKLARLLDDEVLGPLIRTISPEDSSLTSDLTLATMATVFIGNPASTFSAFIGKSRIALGLGNNYFFRAKDGEDGKWRNACTNEEACIFSAVPYWTLYFERQKQRLH